MPIASLQFGNENFPTGVCKYHPFFIPTRAFAGQEMHLMEYARSPHAAENAPMRVLNQQRVPALSGFREETGFWSTASVDLPEGMVLKLFGMKQPKGNGRFYPKTMAYLYVQIRANAALRRVVASTLGSSGLSLQPARSFLNYIEGRFDILSVRDLAGLGVSVLPNTMRMMSAQNVQALFTDQVLQPELQGRTVVRQTSVVNSSGSRVAVQKVKTTRRVRLD